MREICTSGSEGGGDGSIVSPYPYPAHQPYPPVCRFNRGMSSSTFCRGADIAMTQ